GDGGKIRDHQHRHRAESRNGRLAHELPVLGQEQDADRIASGPGPERCADFRSVDLSMDALKTSAVLPRKVAVGRFLPQESGLAMEPCRLDQPTESGRSPAPRAIALSARRLFIFAGTALLTAAGGYEMYGVVKVGGVTVLEA